MPRSSFKEGMVACVAKRVVSEWSSAAGYFRNCLNIRGPLHSKPHLVMNDPHSVADQHEVLKPLTSQPYTG